MECVHTFMCVIKIYFLPCSSCVSNEFSLGVVKSQVQLGNIYPSLRIGKQLAEKLERV